MGTVPAGIEKGHPEACGLGFRALPSRPGNSPTTSDDYLTVARGACQVALGCLGEYRSMVALGTATGIRVFSGQLYFLQHVEEISRTPFYFFR